MLLSVPGQLDELELCSVEDVATVFETKFIVSLDFATIQSSPAPVSFSTSSEGSCWTNGKDDSTHHV